MTEPRKHSPMLVLLDSRSASRYTPYLLEILDVEGYFAREIVDLARSDLASLHLDQYDIVILANGATSPEGQNLLASYVAGGGHLIALRPPAGLAARLGLRASEGIVNKSVRDRYIAIDHQHEVVRDMPCNGLQFHGELDLYTPDGAEVLAWVAGDLEQATGFAAIGLASHGKGTAAVFAYDPCATVVRMRQGKVENASTGANADADGDGRWTPNDLFVGQLDARLKFLPQADLHQDLLARLINRASASRRPIPRAWYFPDAAPCVAYFNGDSDGMDRSDYDTIVSTIERYGGKFTIYLMEEHHALIPPDDEQELRGRGHAFGQHVILEFQTSLEEARAEVSRSLEQFHAFYGYRPLTNRGHCLIWPGWTEMADFLAGGGVRMDQNFIPRRFLRHGYLNGSGLPARFIREDGTLGDIYEQNTHITDDGSVEVDKFLIPGVDRDHVLRDAFRMLDECATTFHGVFQASFHPHLTAQHVLWLLEALAERCRDLGIPMVNGDAWVHFNDARRQIRFDEIDYAPHSGDLSFSVRGDSDVRGLTILLPGEIEGRTLQTAQMDAAEMPVERKRLKGTEYGMVTIDIDADTSQRVTCRFAPADVGAATAISH